MGSNIRAIGEFSGPVLRRNRVKPEGWLVERVEHGGDGAAFAANLHLARRDQAERAGVT